MTEKTEEKKGPTPLDELALNLEMAKKVETNAKEARIEAEEKLLGEIVGEVKGEGSVSFKENYFKVTVKSPINRTIDADIYKELGLKLGTKNPIIKKLSLDTKKYRSLQENDPETFKTLSKCITSKPGKIQVSVERRC